MKLAVLGLGEAGSLIAKGLADQGVEVIGFDPAKPKFAPVPMVPTAEEAVADADVVFSINSSNASIKVAQTVAPHLKPGALYCDLNTGTPSLKVRLSSMVPEGSFVDVAVMKPVPGNAEKVPMGISGPGAIKLMEHFADLDVNFSYVSDVAGEAAARKLLRSIFAKGMAAVVIDYLWAAKEMGLEHWALEEVMNEFDSSSAATVKRYLSGTAKHAKRRSVEMADVVAMLSEIGYDSTMVGPIELTLNQVIHSKKIPFSDLED
jgi:L-threonate 2-dehydrogenase